jgi:hypothetical protein
LTDADDTAASGGELLATEVAVNDVEMLGDILAYLETC